MARRKIKSRRKKYAVPIILSLAALSLVIYYVGFNPTASGQQSSTSQCITNNDCDWRSTNCCSENDGANWECVNLRNFSIDCSSMVLCPQFISPRPQTGCSCDQGSCVAK